MRTQNLDNYRKESKPPNAGEPIITANVTKIPKNTPTIMNRLFIPKLWISQLKMDCIETWKRCGRML